MGKTDTGGLETPEATQGVGGNQADKLSELLDLPEGDHALVEVRKHIVDRRITTLKKFSHIPSPHDEDWSEEFQKGVEHGVLISQQKLRFEIQRLRKLIA